MTTVPSTHPVQPVHPDQAQDPVTCGTCGLTWDDAVSTSWTPAPAGRCPFEYFHNIRTVQTRHLQPGDTVQLPWRKLRRTVHSVTRTEYVNQRGEPLYTVRWAEGRTDEWSAGNLSNRTEDWTVIDDEEG